MNFTGASYDDEDSSVFAPFDDGDLGAFEFDVSSSFPDELQ